MSNKEKVILNSEEAVLYTLLMKQFGQDGFSRFLATRRVENRINKDMKAFGTEVELSFLSVPEHIKDVFYSLMDKFDDLLLNNKDVEIEATKEATEAFIKLLEEKGDISLKKS